MAAAPRRDDGLAPPLFAVVASGPLIGAGSASALGYGGVFLACATITVAAFAALRMVPSEHSEKMRTLLD